MIILERSHEKFRGTTWSPVKHSATLHHVIKVDRNESEDENLRKIDLRFQKVNVSALDMLLMNKNKNPYTEAKIESPYKRGKFIEGFIYVQALAAFVHEKEVHRFEDMVDQISPGSIIGRSVRIDDSAIIEPFVELETGVKIKAGSRIGQNSILRKGSIAQKNTNIGANSYVGQFTNIGEDCILGSSSLIEREVFTGLRSQIGMQSRIGKKTSISRDAFLGDSSQIGKFSFIGRETVVGEMTKIGDYSHIGNTAMIGAESQLGNFVRVAKNVWLVSPTIAPDGAFISQSNLIQARK